PPAAQWQDTARNVSQPTCLIEAIRSPLAQTDASVRVESAAYAITARGFGDSRGGFRASRGARPTSDSLVCERAFLRRTAPSPHASPQAFPESACPTSHSRRGLNSASH